MLANLMASAGMSDAEWAVYWTILAICLIVIFLAAAFAIILVLFQKSNSDGIQGITASSETFYGKNRGRSIESKLKKWSWIVLGVIGALAIVAYIVQVMYKA
ncbi:MAG: preprotein translocase subunit SecG [Clostridia bacterium]|nr:preprotein translocase subunit SecG [Clostridia bacterium]